MVSENRMEFYGLGGAGAFLLRGMGLAFHQHLEEM
jgi:hypothetical protein